MANKGNDKVDNIEESVASDTLRPGGAPGETRSQMLATFTALMAQLGKEDLSHFLNDALAQIGQEAANIPSGAAAQNAATIAAKGAVKEDVADMLAGEDLSEAFKEKASTLFEAAVEARLVTEVARIEEELTEAYENSLSEVVAELTESIDAYLEYAATEWLKENKIAIQSSLKTEITEGFVEELRNLFIRHNINVPEEAVDVVQEMTSKVEALEAELNEAVNRSIELQKIIESAKSAEVFAEVSEGLVATQVEKLRSLSEGIEFTDVDTYKKKLGIIREQYFSGKPVQSTQIINEEVGSNESDDGKPVSSAMPSYLEALNRHARFSKFR